MENLIGKIWMYAIAIIVMIAPFWFFIMLHLWAKAKIKKQKDVSDYLMKIYNLEKEIEFLKRDVADWERIANGNDKALSELKKTWTSPTQQMINEKVNVSFYSSVPINKTVKAVPEEMTKDDLEKCMNFYIEKYG